MRIHFPLIGLCAIFLVLPIRADETRYEAVWHQGKAASLTTAPAPLAAFVDTGKKLVEQGFRLIDAETEVKNGHRFYVGLWTQGTGSNLFSASLTSAGLKQTMKERRAKGMRLLDFEIFRTGRGGIRYLGVWRGGSGEELVTEPLEFAAFSAKGEILTHQQGLRLIDVEVENIGGKLLYSGLFRTGTGSNLITGPLAIADFSAKRDQMVKQGLELVDVERVETGGDQKFVGVWSSGHGESRLSKLRDFSSFFVFSQSQFNAGKHAVDIELFTDLKAPGNPPPKDPVPVPAPPKPPLPPNVELVGGNIFRIDWSILVEGMPRIEIPEAYLPDFLPKVNGEIVLPTEKVCGFNFIQVDSAFWQVGSDPAFDEPPFNAVPNLQELDETLHLQGIRLWGPILGCEGTNQQWTFPSPLTTQGPFNPQNFEGLKLVIQLDPKTSNPDSSPRIEFIPPSSDVEPVQAADLWDEGWIEELLAYTDLLFQTAELSGKNYCDISTLIVEICLEQPLLCPAEDPDGNC